MMTLLHFPPAYTGCSFYNLPPKLSPKNGRFGKIAETQMFEILPKNLRTAKYIYKTAYRMLSKTNRDSKYSAKW